MPIVAKAAFAKGSKKSADKNIPHRNSEEEVSKSNWERERNQPRSSHWGSQV
jgi:hypothetical protein